MIGRGISMESIRKEVRVEVKIPQDEASRVTVNHLIRLREFLINKKRDTQKDVAAFNVVLRNFLTEDEFEKYVINKEPIEY